MANITDTIVVVRLLRLLSTPIEKSDAYKLGIIDNKGKRIKKTSTSQEKDAYTMLNRFIFKIQQALMTSPNRSANRLLTFAAALAILKENNQDQAMLELLEKDDEGFESLLSIYESFDDVKTQSTLLEYNIVSFKSFREEVAANSAGAGAVHGIGIGPKGEPGRDPVMMPMVRRKRKKKILK
jgi:hypothetical protein